jgi:hypothetical protein
MRGIIEKALDAYEKIQLKRREPAQLEAKKHASQIKNLVE